MLLLYRNAKQISIVLGRHFTITYTNLLTSGRLNAYLADIDRQAQERFERLLEDMKQVQGITEHLKAENAIFFVICTA